MNCRIFTERLGDIAPGSTVVLEGEEARYLTRVLRIGEGEKVTLCSPEGLECECTVSAVMRKSAELKVESLETVDRESPLKITLCQALPKGKKMDLILQKGTELGISRFVPFVSSRSVSRPEDGGKAARWSKIVLEASRQCGRNFIPSVKDPLSFEKMLEEFSTSRPGLLKLVPWEGEESRGLRALAEEEIREAVFLIGPEGGFSAEEIALAEKAGFTTVTLGKRLLRTETAGLTAAAILQYIWGDMG